MVANNKIDINIPKINKTISSMKGGLESAFVNLLLIELPFSSKGI
jgi:hypothetical protein